MTPSGAGEIRVHLVAQFSTQAAWCAQHPEDHPGDKRWCDDRANADDECGLRAFAQADEETGFSRAVENWIVWKG